MRLRLAALLAVIGLLTLGGFRTASAQIFSTQIQPTFVAPAGTTCPTSMGNLISLPATGFLCWQVSNNSFYVFGNGTWNQVATAGLSGFTLGSLTVSTLTASTSAIISDLVIGPSTTSAQLLQNDFVIVASANTVAPAGPLVKGLTVRVRPATFFPTLANFYKVPPATCVATLAGGNSFGAEFAILLQDTTNPLAKPTMFLPAGTLGCQ